MSNKDLHPLLVQIRQGISGVQTTLQTLVGEVQEVKTTIREGVKTIVEAINDNTQAQAEIKLIDEMTEVHSLEPQVEAEEAVIESEREELEETLETVRERYREKQTELDELADERIRDVGEHIFEIDEREFEAAVETPFVEHVTGTWADIRDHNETSQSTREDRLTDAIGLASTAIDGFIGRRKNLLQAIDEHRTTFDLGQQEPAVVQVPFWELTIRNGAEKQTVVVGPADARPDTGWVRTGLQEYEEFDELLESVAATPPTQLAPSEISRGDLISAIESNAKSELGGLVSYDESYEALLADDLTVEVEVEG